MKERGKAIIVGEIDVLCHKPDASQSQSERRDLISDRRSINHDTNDTKIIHLSPELSRWKTHP